MSNIPVYPCASFSLRHYDLPYNNTSGTSSTNSVGYATNFRTTSVWTNVNIKQIIGEAYDKYNVFNIVLSSISAQSGSSSSGGTGAFGASAEDRLFMLYMSGLNWKNQSYDSSQKINTISALVGQYYWLYGSANTDVRGQIMPSCCTFTKSNPVISNLTISMYRNSDGTAPVSGTRPWSLVFNFDIYGVEEEIYQ